VKLSEYQRKLHNPTYVSQSINQSTHLQSLTDGRKESITRILITFARCVKSKMVAGKPAGTISQLIDKLAMKFQRTKIFIQYSFYLTGADVNQIPKCLDYSATSHSKRMLLEHFILLKTDRKTKTNKP